MVVFFWLYRKFDFIPCATSLAYYMNCLTSPGIPHSEDEKHRAQIVLNVSSCSDAQLWEQFTLGNKDAFDTIYDRHFQLLCYYGDRICEDKGLVEDVVQDLFIYLWTKKERLGKTNAIKFYLFRCLRRKLMRALTQQKRRTDRHTVLEINDHRFQLSLQRSSRLPLEEKELQDKLAAALGRLTDRQKEAIYLRFYNNLSFQEVASIMDLEVRSVYNLIGRTLAILRGELRHHEPSTAWLVSFLLLFVGY